MEHPGSEAVGMETEPHSHSVPKVLPIDPCLGDSKGRAHPGWKFCGGHVHIKTTPLLRGPRGEVSASAKQSRRKTGLPETHPPPAPHPAQWQQVNLGSLSQEQLALISPNDFRKQKEKKHFPAAGVRWAPPWCAKQIRTSLERKWQASLSWMWMQKSQTKYPQIESSTRKRKNTSPPSWMYYRNRLVLENHSYSYSYWYIKLKK